MSANEINKLKQEASALADQIDGADTEGRLAFQNL